MCVCVCYEVNLIIQKQIQILLYILFYYVLLLLLLLSILNNKDTCLTRVNGIMIITLLIYYSIV